jgi:hypothetical protein
MINGLMRESGDAIHYTSSFRNVIEDHLQWLKQQAGTSVVQVTAMQAHKYEFDAAGLYNELSIPAYMHWVVSRMNGLKSLTEVPAELTQLIVPSSDDISRLASVHAMAVRL